MNIVATNKFLSPTERSIQVLLSFIFFNLHNRIEGQQCGGRAEIVADFDDLAAGILMAMAPAPTLTLKGIDFSSNGGYAGALRVVPRSGKSQDGQATLTINDCSFRGFKSKVS